MSAHPAKRVRRMAAGDTGSGLKSSSCVRLRVTFADQIVAPEPAAIRTIDAVLVKPRTSE